MTTCTRKRCDRETDDPTGLCRQHRITDRYPHPLVDATQALAHVRWCLNHGATIYGIAEGTGVSHGVIRDQVAGKRDRMRKSTADALMRATPKMNGHVPAFAAGRRVRALRAAGWWIKELVGPTGLSKTFLISLCAEEWDTISACNDAKVRRAYEQLGETIHRPVHPSSKAARWPLPLEWDDIDHDLNPMPHNDRGERLVHGTPEHQHAARALLATRPGREWVEEGWPPGWLNKVAGEEIRPRIGIELADRLIATARNIKPSTRKKDAA